MKRASDKANKKTRKIKRKERNDAKKSAETDVEREDRLAKRQVVAAAKRSSETDAERKKQNATRQANRASHPDKEKINAKRRQNYAEASPEKKRVKLDEAHPVPPQLTEEQKDEYNQYRENLIKQAQGKPVGAKSNIDIFQWTKDFYYNVGVCDVVCCHCNALGFKGENKAAADNGPHFGQLCCNQNKIRLNEYPTPPAELIRLFAVNTPIAKYFREHIRMFNAGVAMASLKVTDKTVHGRGPAAFKISGQLLQRIGPLTAYSDASEYNCVQAFFLIQHIRISIELQEKEIPQKKKVPVKNVLKKRFLVFCTEFSPRTTHIYALSKVSWISSRRTI